MQTAKRLYLVPVIFTVMLLVAACGGDDPTPTPATVESAPAQVEPVATPAQQETTNTEGGAAPSTGNAATDAVAEALRRQIASLPMRMTVTAGAEGEAMSAELVSPDRFHVNAGGMEILMVDGTVYMKQGDTWIANETMGAMANAIMGQYMPENIEAQIATIVSAEQLSDEDINGEAASVYAFTVTSPIEGTDNVVSRLYVRKSDGLPIRIASGTDAEEQYQVDYAYDPSIVIEAP